MRNACWAGLLLAATVAAADPLAGRPEPTAIAFMTSAQALGTVVATSENPGSPEAQVALTFEKSALAGLTAVWTQTAQGYLAGTVTAAQYTTLLNNARWQSYAAMVYAQVAYFQKSTANSAQASIDCWNAQNYCLYALTLPLPTANLTAEMTALLAKHNSYRAGLGLRALNVDLRLQVAAVGHANWMAAARTMSHTESDGSQPIDRAVRQGYAGSSYGVGENIAYGYATVDAVFAAWLASPPHQQDIANSSWTSIGLSVATGSDGLRYWSVEFGYLNP